MTDFLFGVTPMSTIVFIVVVGLLAAVAVRLIRNERRVNRERIGGFLDLTGVPVAVVAPDPDDWGFSDVLGWDAPGRFADFRDEAA